MADSTGKVALVTGASRGIGAAIALRLAAEGAAVAVNYAGLARLPPRRSSPTIEARGGTRASRLQADVERPGGVRRRSSAATVAELGALDILVNNAGITRDGLLVRMSDEDWAAVIATNLIGRVLHDPRRRQGDDEGSARGAIVNIASVVGLVGNAGQANYAAAKAGVIGLTKSVARELAPRGVRANAVARASSRPT